MRRFSDDVSGAPGPRNTGKIRAIRVAVATFMLNGRDVKETAKIVEAARNAGRFLTLFVVAPPFPCISKLLAAPVARASAQCLSQMQYKGAEQRTRQRFYNPKGFVSSSPG